MTGCTKETSGAPLTGARSRRLLTAALGALLVLATLVAYGSFADFEFVNWDDKQYVSENVYVRAGLTKDSVRWALSATDCFNWHPLTWVSHMLDVELFGFDAVWHHRTNLGLHVLSTLVLFLAFLRMTGAPWRSAIVAGLFALHPLQVESVAWISERKAVLSGLCFAGALRLYARHAERPSTMNYAFVALALAAGLMAKPMLVTLPGVLLLLDVWPLCRLRVSPVPDLRRLGILALEKLPLVALCAASSAITLVAQRGAISLAARYTLEDRLGNALVSYVRYLAGALLPLQLSPSYPHPETWAPSALLSCVALLALVTAVTLRLLPTRPWLAVGWLWFLGMLVPVIGVVQVGDQSMADRYMYLPSIGLFVMAAWGLPSLLPEFPRRTRALASLSVSLLAICGALTRSQVLHWKNSATLWEHARSVDPNDSLAVEMLGLLAQGQERYSEAIELYRRAVELDPRRQNPQHNLGTLLAWTGRPAEAVGPLREAIRLRPDFAAAYESLGHAYRELGEFEPSLQAFRRSVELDPGSVTAQYNLGHLLGSMGRSAEAVGPLREAVRLRPDFAVAHESLGHAYSDIGELGPSIESFQRSVEVAPGASNAQYSLGMELLRSGRAREAIGPLSEAVRLQPDFTLALVALVDARIDSGDRHGALEAGSRALRLARDQGHSELVLEIEKKLERLRD